ncbi:unnamed protein product [Mytilus coruscus]|uniref:Uncharacterized protein n=1 Tax=Mytilus coruscus TaxID=42192 RepID=A0A6J8EM76_MYTCO|nr:unnamed protein product [Mytilus coruscus]
MEFILQISQNGKRKMMLAGQKHVHPKQDVLLPIETTAFVYLLVSVIASIAIKNYIYTPCDNNQCQNGALCIYSVKDYSCRCLAGYKGSHCERTPCSSGPCRNAGTCSISGSSYSCACKHGYYGTQCESYACSPNPCRNGGACNPTGGSSYNCACTNGWYGTICNQIFRQRLTSPGFPVEYAVNMHMTWKIAVGIGNIVALRFTDFKLESCCDYVKVYDGVESEANILGSFNTAKVPPEVFTTGNVIVITMTTDHSIQYKGFSADIYETILKALLYI